MKGKLALAVGVLVATVTAVRSQSSGTVLWEFDAGAGIFDPPTIGLDGTLYVGGGQTGSNKFYAINPDGTKKWEFDAPNASSGCVGRDGTVHVGSIMPNSSARLFALNPDGTKSWDFSPNFLWFKTSIGAGGMIYVASLSTLTACAPDGSVKWIVRNTEFGSQSASLGHPTIAADGSIIVSSSSPDNRLFAFSPGGSTRWAFSTGRRRVDSSYGFSILGELWSPPAIGADGTIYVGAYLAGTGLDTAQPIFLAVGPDGIAKWQIPLPGIPGGAPAVASDGTIYLWIGDATLKNRLLALNQNGSLRWESPLGGPPLYQTSPALAEDGTICVGTTQGKLLVLNTDGIKTREYTLEGLISSPVIGNNGTIYVGSWLGSSDRGKLYALRGTSGPAQSPWPMYRKTPQQTGSVDDTLARRPVLLLPRGSVAESLELCLVGERGKAYRLESSSDLATWEQVLVVIAANSTATVSLPRSAFKQQFYRAVAE